MNLKLLTTKNRLFFWTNLFFLLTILGVIAVSFISAQEQTKGSRFHLQNFVNNHKEELSGYITSSSSSLLLFSSLNIEWISPIKKTNNIEYQDDFLEKLEFGNYTNELRKYWPRKGPVWDGLGLVNNEKGKGIVLVEAKAHTSETFSDMKAKAPESIKQIEKTFLEAKKFYKVSAESDWTKERYQLANRITFLYLLNEKLKIPTWLIFVNFIEDNTNIPTSKKEFIEHTRKELKELGLNENSPLIDRIIILYIKPK